MAPKPEPKVLGNTRPITSFFPGGRQTAAVIPIKPLKNPVGRPPKQPVQPAAAAAGVKRGRTQAAEVEAAAKTSSSGSSGSGSQDSDVVEELEVVGDGAGRKRKRSLSKPRKTPKPRDHAAENKRRKFNPDWVRKYAWVLSLVGGTRVGCRACGEQTNLAPHNRQTVLLSDVEASVKQQLSQAAEAVLVDLSRRFPPVKVLEASKLVYPQYWWGELGLDGKRVAPTPADVEAKLATLKEYYGVSKPAPSISGFAGAGPSNGEPLTPLLDFEKLFEQRALFASEAPEQATIVMDAAANGAKLPKGTFVAFWQSMTQSRWVADGCSEYVRLAKLVATIVPGSVEAERLFSTMSYIKDSQRNKLQQRHLALAVRMMAQRWFGVSDFPYAEALKHWREGAEHRWAD